MKDKIEQGFKFEYRTLGEDYNVIISAKTLNEALIKFSRYYHEVEKIYSVDVVQNDAVSDTTGSEQGDVAGKQSTPNKDKEGIDVASDSKPIYPSKENGFNRGLGSPYDKVNENLLTSDNNSEVSPVATLGSDSGNSIEQKVANKILAHLKTNNLSKKDLADLLEVKPQRIQKIVGGKQNLTLKTISDIEKALKIKLIHV